MPYLYRLFISMTGRDSPEIDTVGPSVAMAYATLMHHRSPELSAFSKDYNCYLPGGSFNRRGKKNATKIL